MSEQILTHEYLRECLHYSVITGELYWRKTVNSRAKVGALAGCLSVQGYRDIQINGKQYRAHRLAWFWVTGRWPGNEIDHKNGIRNANHWLNLREATHSQNAINSALRSNNTSGFKGVHWNKATQKWQGHITLSRKQIYLGSFDTPEDARAARMRAEKDMHGEFARRPGV